MPNTALQEESRLKMLRLLEANPQVNQRDLAQAMGVSLGKANYCLGARVDKGFVKAQNFKNSKNKLAYAYLFTPRGIAANIGLGDIDASQQLLAEQIQSETAKPDRLTNALAISQMFRGEAFVSAVWKKVE